MLGGLAALAAMAFGTGSAGAATISPQGPFTPTSSSASFIFLGAGLQVKCASSTFPGTVNAPSGGVQSITGGAPTFSNCTAPRPWGPTVPVTANETATYEITALAGGATTTVRNINLHFEIINTYRGNCVIDAQGVMASETTGFYPISISQLVFETTQRSQPSTLKVSHVANCIPQFYVNEPIAFSATYKLDHSLLVSN
jgi:hypothetical protein